MLNVPFHFSFHLLETVFFHPALLLFFLSHLTLPHLLSQIITSDQYPLPRYLFSLLHKLLRHSSLCFNFIRLVVFLSTPPFNRPVKMSSDVSYFLHIPYSEQCHIGRMWVKRGKTPHWYVVMCHRASCYHLVFSISFQLVQTTRLKAKDRAASEKRSVIRPDLLKILDNLRVFTSFLSLDVTVYIT